MVAHCQVGGRSACAIVFSGSASTSPSSMTQISVRRKVEPSYFDSRRGWNAQSLDIGFAPDSLKMTTMACPAVEFLCLVGLQRFRPASTTHRRVFVDHTWLDPLSVSTGPGARERSSGSGVQVFAKRTIRGFAMVRQSMAFGSLAISSP